MTIAIFVATGTFIAGIVAGYLLRKVIERMDAEDAFYERHDLHLIKSPADTQR